jgi:subtilisin-like proprotein convertase family protein
MLKKLFFALTMLFWSTIIFSQENFSNFWKKIQSKISDSESIIPKPNFPAEYKIYQLDLDQLKQLLIQAPKHGEFFGMSNLVISFPVADGSFQRFAVFEWSIMDPQLAAKYPMIKSYAAQGIDDPTATMRFSITQFGLHSMILSGKNATCYIDPYTKTANYYVVYSKKSLGTDSRTFECSTDDHVGLPSLENEKAGPNQLLNTNDRKLRNYRLAQSCNAEYGNIFATNPGTEKADIQAQMTITMTRVNGIYERDLAVHMDFIANNDTLIFYGSTSADPWSNEFNTKTAQTIDARVGVANYDIGHNFNTSGGGNAGCIGCVCLSTSQSSTHKGRGYTGSSNPVGDPFDIDYVAHEMGHQFGGYHVMNTCSRSGSGQTEVEPASGSSIMGYAGICSSNVQSNSHDDFNYVNVRDISANVKTGNSTCAQITNLTNQPPTASAGNDYIIPKSTAYVLEGSATDPDGLNSLTYSWSQNDPTQSPGNAAPLATYSVGPMYRSIPPTTSPNRYMPTIASVIAGNLTPTWEVTPSVGRIMNFSFLVRDNDAQGGQTASDLMKVTVDGNSGPFVITSQNTATAWNAGTVQNITWNVANTTNAPVNCQNVDIYLSTDGGYTYPVTIATGLPNNGSASINVPQVTTTNGRIMVRGSGNIFFDINGGTISIQSAEFTMTPAALTQQVCPPNDHSFAFTYNTYLNFNETTTFSATGNPAGSIVTFSPASATSDNTPVTVTITGLTESMAGAYNLIITGTSASTTKSSSINFNVFNTSLTQPLLAVPANNTNGVNSSLVLSWNSLAGSGITYSIDVALDSLFTTIVSSTIGLTTNSYSVNGLTSSTSYFWRVKAENVCTTSVFSDVFKFTTSNCSSILAVNVPVSISSGAPSTVTSTLTVTANGTITDVNVVNVFGTHTYINDLTLSVKSPANTSVTLMDQICNSEENFALSFDDASALTSFPCPPIDSLVYKPTGLLSLFNGQNASGTWTFSVKDNANQDGGSLNKWGLELCLNSAIGIKETILVSSAHVFPNPTTGVLNINLGGTSNEQFNITIVNSIGQTILITRARGDENLKINLVNYSAGIYQIIIDGKNTRQYEKLMLGN